MNDASGPTQPPDATSLNPPATVARAGAGYSTGIQIFSANLNGALRELRLVMTAREYRDYVSIGRLIFEREERAA